MAGDSNITMEQIKHIKKPSIHVMEAQLVHDYRG